MRGAGVGTLRRQAPRPSPGWGAGRCSGNEDCGGLSSPHTKGEMRDTRSNLFLQLCFQTVPQRGRREGETERMSSEAGAASA